MEENKIDLFVYVHKALKVVLRTWKKAVIALFISCIGFVVFSWITYTPVYRSKITFSVIKEFNGSASFSYNKDATDKLVGSFLTILNSDLMVHAICNDLKIDAIPATFSIERIGTTNLFSVYASSNSAEQSKDVLDSLVRNYTKISKVALNDATLTVIEEPVLASVPTNQIQYIPLLLKGLILGSILYGMYVAAYVLIRRSITKDSDIKVHLHSKCLCRIPKIKILKGKKILINQPIRVQNHLKDCFHKVRMEIENTKMENGHSTFMITSTSAHEGKSTIAANTALSLANKGHSVLLVDFDLRNPTQSKNFDLKVENAKILKLPNTTLSLYTHLEDGNLDILSAYKAEEKASEILANREVYAILREAKRKYDYIIVDTPPMQVMADTLVVAGYVDSIILVVKEDFASVVDIKDALQSLQRVNHNLLGCILNQCEQGSILSSYYGYRYGYGYGYGYGYSYGHSKKKEDRDTE